MCLFELFDDKSNLKQGEHKSPIARIKDDYLSFILKLIAERFKITI